MVLGEGEAFFWAACIAGLSEAAGELVTPGKFVPLPVLSVVPGNPTPWDCGSGMETGDGAVICWGGLVRGACCFVCSTGRDV